MALTIVGTHPDLDWHHQDAINGLAWAIRDKLGEIENGRQALR
jgi:hypothetical protein